VSAQHIKVGSSGTFSVRVTNAAGCQSPPADSVTVSLNSLPPPVVAVAGNLTFCPGDSVVLTAPVADAYRWSNGMTSRAIAVKQSGMYSVQIIDGNGCGSHYSAPVRTVVLPTPEKPVISRLGTDSLRASGPATVYQWQRDGIALPAGTREIRATEEGVYTVRAVENNCLSEASEAFHHTSPAVTGVSTLLPGAVAVYPNPCGGKINLSITHPRPFRTLVSVYTTMGTRLLLHRFEPVPPHFSTTIDLSGFPAGFYFIHVSTPQKTYRYKIVKR
jgi:hypothetical protein